MLATASVQACSLFGLLVAPLVAGVSQGRRGHGLIGYGISMYDPPCAFACLGAAQSWMLDCEEGVAGAGGHHHDDAGADGMPEMVMEEPSPECYATNDPFLQTVAWCISTHCDGVSMSQLEEFWDLNIAGRMPIQPSPKYSYQKALQLVEKQPTNITGSDEVLVSPSLVDEEAYLSTYNGNYGFETMEVKSAQFGLVLLLTCIAIPIAFSLLRFLPLPPSLVSKFYAYLIDPPVFGRYHAVPVLGLGFIPTRGQAIFIAYIWIINIVLSAVGYKLTNPNSWYSTLNGQLLGYISNRIGTLSFVNLAIAVLYSGRNNILLYLSNWSHSTFLLIHRWVAVICMLQACIHSVMYVRIFRQKGASAYSEERQLEYWIWGIIATVSFVLLMPLSVMQIRQKAYEVFLASHVVLSLLGMIACILHIYYRYEWQWGYEVWVWIALAFFLFDRFLARPLRLAKNGLKTAFITVIDDEYFQIDIPEVHADGIAYLYFPTVTWRVWENHPFSVAALSGATLSGVSCGSNSTSHSDIPPADSPTAEKNAHITTKPSTEAPKKTGITFYVRRRNGLTDKLVGHKKARSGIPVLVESSYGSDEMSIVPSPSPHPTIDYPNLICIAGGVGISAVLPFLDKADGFLPPLGTIKLFWGARTEPLVESVERMLGQEGGRENGRARWGKVDVSVSVGERFDFRVLLENELRGGAAGGTTVVVCGPPGMADDVRSAVAGLARHGSIVRMVEESFSW